jgi:hypothetical protein
MDIRGVKIKSVANTIPKHTKIQFKANDGWLWRFSKGHGITHMCTISEALCVMTKEAESFKKKKKSSQWWGQEAVPL